MKYDEINALCIRLMHELNDKKSMEDQEQSKSSHFKSFPKKVSDIIINEFKKFVVSEREYFNEENLIKENFDEEGFIAAKKNIAIIKELLAEFDKEDSCKTYVISKLIQNTFFYERVYKQKGMWSVLSLSNMLDKIVAPYIQAVEMILPAIQNELDSLDMSPEEWFTYIDALMPKKINESSDKRGKSSSFEAEEENNDLKNYYAHKELMQLLKETYIALNLDINKNSAARLLTPHPLVPKSILGNKDKRVFSSSDVAHIKKYFSKNPKKVEYSMNNNNHYAVIKIPDQDDKDQFYAMVKTLGSGTFGTTNLAQNIETGEWVAIKVSENQNNQFFQNEVSFLEKANLYKGQASVDKDSVRGKDYLALKLLKDDEIRNLAKNNKFTIRNKIDLLIDMLEQMHSMHEKRIIHADIKPENMMYDATNKKLKFIDYGFSLNLPPDSVFLIHTHINGTPGFIAPEIRAESKYSRESDIYALGITFLEVLGIKPVELALEEDEIIKREDKTKLSKSEKKINATIRMLVKQHMCADSPDKRMLAPALLLKLKTIQLQYHNVLEPLHENFFYQKGITDVTHEIKQASSDTKIELVKKRILSRLDSLKAQMNINDTKKLQIIENLPKLLEADNLKKFENSFKILSGKLLISSNLYEPPEKKKKKQILSDTIDLIYRDLYVLSQMDVKQNSQNYNKNNEGNNAVQSRIPSTDPLQETVSNNLERVINQLKPWLSLQNNKKNLQVEELFMDIVKIYNEIIKFDKPINKTCDALAKMEKQITKFLSLIQSAHPTQDGSLSKTFNNINFLMHSSKLEVMKNISQSALNSNNNKDTSLGVKMNERLDVIQEEYSNTVLPEHSSSSNNASPTMLAAYPSTNDAVKAEFNKIIGECEQVFNEYKGLFSIHNVTYSAAFKDAEFIFNQIKQNIPPKFPEVYDSVITMCKKLNDSMEKISFTVTIKMKVNKIIDKCKAIIYKFRTGKALPIDKKTYSKEGFTSRSDFAIEQLKNIHGDMLFQKAMHSKPPQNDKPDKSTIKDIKKPK